MILRGGVAGNRKELHVADRVVLVPLDWQ